MVQDINAVRGNWPGIRVISSEDEIRRALELAAPILYGTDSIDESWLRQNGMTAAVVGDGVSYWHGEWIAEAARDMDVRECYAVMTQDPFKNRCYMVRMSPDDLFQYAAESTIAPFILFPPDRRIAVLQHINDYTIIAGPSSFVRHSIGSTFDTAKRMLFDDFLRAGHSEQFKAILRELWDRYEPLHPKE